MDHFLHEALAPCRSRSPKYWGPTVSTTCSTRQRALPAHALSLAPTIFLLTQIKWQDDVGPLAYFCQTNLRGEVVTTVISSEHFCADVLLWDIGQLMEAAMSGPNSSLRTARQNESWLGADDQRLLSLHENHRTWTKVSEALPGRSVEACKQRFKKIQSRSQTELPKRPPRW